MEDQEYHDAKHHVSLVKQTGMPNWDGDAKHTRISYWESTVTFMSRYSVWDRPFQRYRYD